MGLFDTGYGETRRGIGWYPKHAAQAAPLSLWDLTEAAAMTPIPGVADVASGALAARDFREGRPLSGLLNAAGALPFVPALGNIFIGVRGANKAQKQALVTAQKMAKEGAGRDEIWNATLWAKGPDGKWRTEIDDSKIGFDWLPMKPTPEGYSQISKALPDYIQHDALFGAFPDLKSVDVQRSTSGFPASGSFDEMKQRIQFDVPTEQAAKSTTLHELQHAVQQREGFARGGSPESVDALIAPETIPEWVALNDKALTLQKAGKHAQADKVFDQRDAILYNEPYRRLAGEAEARLAANRMNLTMPERQAMPPWSEGPYGWDVPEADQIVRMEGGPAMMVQPKRLEQGLLGEPGYVYHATNDERLRDILASGKLKTHKPGDFTDQDMWPDGTVEKRAYFGKSPENLWQFAPEEGTPVVLRTKNNPETFKRESTGDIFTKKPVSAKDIEFLGDDGKWHSLKELTSAP